MLVCSVFCDRYYIGQQAYIVITDLDMLKQVMVKDFDNFSDHVVSCFCIYQTCKYRYVYWTIGVAMHACVYYVFDHLPMHMCAQFTEWL